MKSWIKRGGHDFENFYLCTICREKQPKLILVGCQFEFNSRICPECDEPMRGIPHNPRYKRKLEAMGLIKRY